MRFQSEIDVIRLVVADAEPSYREHARRILEEHPRINLVGTAQSATHCLRLVRQTMPDAVLLDYALPDMTGLEAAEQIARAVPETVIIIYTDHPNLELTRRASSLAKQVINRPMSAADIEGAVEVEVDRLRRYYQEQVDSGVPAAEEGISPFRLRLGKKKEVEVRDRFHAIPHTVILVTSPKGGVGKTSLTVNMAVSAVLYGMYKPRVAVVDMNELVYLALQMGLIQGDTVVESIVGQMDKNLLMWEHVEENYGAEQLADFMVQHTSGVWVLPGVPRPEQIEQVDADLIEKVIKILGREFELVIIDGPPSMITRTTWVSSLLANKIFVVITPEVQCVKGVHDATQIFAHPQINAIRKASLVINRYDIPYGMTVKEVTKVMNLPLTGLIPDTPEILRSIQRGEPFVLGNQNSPYSVAVRATLNEVFPVFSSEMVSEVKETKKRGLFGFGRGSR